MAAVRVYSNESAGQIFIARGTVGAWPFHCLQAVGNGDGTVNIRNKARSYESGDSFLSLRMFRLRIWLMMLMLLGGF